jgi:hypothetical protein
MNFCGNRNNSGGGAYIIWMKKHFHRRERRGSRGFLGVNFNTVKRDFVDFIRGL